MKTIKELKQQHRISGKAVFLYYIGAISIKENEDPKLRILHPIGFVYGLILTIWAILLHGLIEVIPEVMDSVTWW